MASKSLGSLEIPDVFSKIFLHFFEKPKGVFCPVSNIYSIGRREGDEGCGAGFQGTDAAGTAGHH